MFKKVAVAVLLVAIPWGAHASGALAKGSTGGSAALYCTNLSTGVTQSLTSDANEDRFEAYGGFACYGD